MKLATVWFGVLAALVGAFFGLRYIVNYQSNSIQSELDRFARHEPPGPTFAKYRLVCFNSTTGNERQDFARAAKMAGGDIDRSMKACGVDKSCCDIGSDTPGTVGLVEANGEVKCVVARFAYILVGAKEACMKPSQLKVSRETFSSRTTPIGRPWVGNSGDPYYRIDALPQ